LFFAFANSVIYKGNLMKKKFCFLYLLSAINISFASESPTTGKKNNKLCTMLKEYFIKYPFAAKIDCNKYQTAEPTDKKKSSNLCPEEWYLIWAGLYPDKYLCSQKEDKKD
jgi:hypothetical protein